VFAIIGTMVVFGITFGLALVAYAMYLTWEPADDRERRATSQKLKQVSAKELKVESA
jgi:hypothetical protein